VGPAPKEAPDGLRWRGGQGWHCQLEATLGTVASMPVDVVRYPRYRFPTAIISHAVWLYYRFTLSFRDVEDLLAQRGVMVSYESIRHWCQTFGATYARRLRRRAGPVGDTWHLDELLVTIRGRRQYLWRAVEQDGEVIDILLQPRRDCHAAARFLRRLLKRSGRVPHRLVTDRLGSDRAARRTVMPSVIHDTQRYANHVAEASHQPTRQRERAMRGFKSAPHAQRFLAVHGVVRNLFAVGRHRLRARHQRQLRARAFETWNAVIAA
jgi:putative transposase